MENKYYSNLFSKITLKYTQKNSEDISYEVVDKYVAKDYNIELNQNIVNESVSEDNSKGNILENSTNVLTHLVEECDQLNTRKMISLHNKLFNIVPKMIIFIQCGNKFLVFDECCTILETNKLGNSVLDRYGRNVISLRKEEMQFLLSELIKLNIESVLVTQYNYKNMQMKRKPTNIIKTVEDIAKFDFINLFLQQDLRKHNVTNIDMVSTTLNVDGKICDNTNHNEMIKQIIEDCKLVYSRKMIEFHEVLYHKYHEHIIFIQQGNSFYIYNECAERLEILKIKNYTPSKHGSNIESKRICVGANRMKMTISKLVELGISSIIITQYNSFENKLKRRPSAVISTKDELALCNFDNLYLRSALRKEKNKAIMARGYNEYK